MTALLPAPAPPRVPSARPPAAPVAARALEARLVLVAALAVALTGGALVAALLVGGGAPSPATPGLPDAGAVVGWGVPAVRLLGRLLAVLVVGSLLVAAVLVPAGEDLPRSSARALRTAAAAAAAWGVAEVVSLVLLTGSLIGRPPWRLVPADVLAVVTALPAGRDVPAVLLLLGVVGLGARAARTAGQARVLLVVALAAVVLPVTTSGHPAAAGDHALTVATLSVHVVSASLWVGGLVGVLLHVRDAGPSRAVAVGRLSRLALVCVVATAGTGVAGALLVTDVPPGRLLVSGYGALLLAKTAALALLVAAGWVHRRRTLPLLASGRPGAFRRVAVVEVVLMAVTLALAAGLSLAPPPAAAAEVPAAAAPPVVPAPAAPPPLHRPHLHRCPCTRRPAPAAPAAAGAPDEAAPPAQDMSGHDHGELSVAVLVDDGRFHVGDPVAAGAPVTVYNTGPDAVALRAEDGSFDEVVPSRTFLSFAAPAAPGSYTFSDPADGRYRDVLTVVPPVG